MHPCVAAPAQSPQPLAVEQMRARELGCEAGVVQVIERFAVEGLGRVVGGHQRIRAGEQPERPRRAGRFCPLAETIQRGSRGIFITTAHGRLDRVGERVCPDPENVLLKHSQRVQASRH